MLIHPPTVQFDLMCGGTAAWQASVVAAAGLGQAEAWRQIEAIISSAMKVLDLASAEPAEWSVQEGAPGQPAYIVRWSSAIAWEPK
jgi:hypothetical protein